MPNPQQTLSLAAVAQCCILVQRMAKTGCVDENNLSRMVRTALVLDTPNLETLYGGIEDISRGLRFIMAMTERRPDPGELEVIRMVNTALQLQSSLRHSDTNRTVLGKRLTALSGDKISVPLADTVYFEINDIYTEAVSPLKPRIIVNGAEGYLQSAAMVAKVRSALLACIRNAYLWHQFGGRRWHLVFYRRRYNDQSRVLLEH